MSNSPDDYQRGVDAGIIETRLAGHDKHFAAINGSLARLADEMHELTLAVQRLGDQAVSRDATVITTAAALKDAEEARRTKSEQSWTPFARLAVVISALVALIGIVLAIYANAR